MLWKWHQNLTPRGKGTNSYHWNSFTCWFIIDESISSCFTGGGNQVGQCLESHAQFKSGVKSSLPGVNSIKKLQVYFFVIALACVKFRPTKIEFSKIPCVSTSMRLVKGICKNFYWIIQIYVDLKKQGSDCDQTLPAQPISIWNTQSRKKAHKPLRTLWISQKMCLPCLINSHNLVILTIE